MAKSAQLFVSYINHSLVWGLSALGLCTVSNIETLAVIKLYRFRYSVTSLKFTVTQVTSPEAIHQVSGSSSLEPQKASYSLL